MLNVGGQTVDAAVDSVFDLIELKAGDVKSFPQMSASIESRFITGIGSLEHGGRDRMLILLDIAAQVDSVKLDIGAEQESSRASRFTPSRA